MTINGTDDLPLGQTPVPQKRIGGPRRRADRSLEKARLVERMVQMKLAGFTYMEIARQVGYSSKQACHRAIWTYIKSVPIPAVDEYRALENQRLDGYQLLVWDKLRKASTGPGWWAAMDRLLRISRDRRQLNGLDLGPAPILPPGYGEPDAQDDDSAERTAWREQFQSLSIEKQQELYDQVKRLMGNAPGDRPL
jgi:hypothetical protein